MKTIWKSSLLAGLVGLTLLAACSDNEQPIGAGGAAGSAGAGAGTAGAAGGDTGGTAGTAGGAGIDGGGTGGSAGTAGTAGAAGTAGTAGTAGNGGTAGSDGGTPTGPVDPTTIVVIGASGDAGAPPERLLVAGTDYATKTEIASVDPGAKSVVGRVTVADGDAVPAASGGTGFVLERTNDIVDVLDSAGAISTSIDVAAAPGGSATNQQKAYVTLYGANRVAVLDLAAGKVAASVELASYLGAGDGDGAVDVDNAVYDPATHRAYVTLSRIDRTTIAPPDFHLACPPEKSLLVAIDTNTDAILGTPIDLSLVDPVSMALDATNDRLLIAAAGCYDAADGGAARAHAGVEAVALPSGTSTVLWQPTADDFINRLIPIGAGEILLDRFDASFAEHWTDWKLSGAGPGAELTGVPSAPSADGAGGLLGAESSFTDAGTSTTVVRYTIATQTSSAVVADPWQSGVTNAAGTALVK